MEIIFKYWLESLRGILLLCFACICISLSYIGCQLYAGAVIFNLLVVWNFYTHISRPEYKEYTYSSFSVIKKLWSVRKDISNCLFNVFTSDYSLKIELVDAVEVRTTTLSEPFPNQESILEINFIDHTSSSITTSVVVYRINLIELVYRITSMINY